MDALAPRIRRATRADELKLAAIAELTFRETWLEGFRMPYSPADVEAFIDQANSRAAFLRMLADPANKLWLAESTTGEALGYAVAGACKLPHPETAAGDAELKRLYLRRSAQGQGLAARVMETVLKAIDPAGGRRVWLGVWSGNHRAQRFYARYGFEKVGEYDYHVGSTVDHEWIMRRG